MFYKTTLNKAVFNKVTFRKIITVSLAAAGIAVSSLSGTVSAEIPSDVSSLDRTSHGYGQGVETNDQNRPVGAEMFNNDFGEYGCYAMLDEDKEIHLTFDQGYENGYTAPILDTLKEKNVKAVFFLTGDYAERNEELVKRMIDEGHIIGNHGMKHASLPTLSVSDAEKEIMSLHDFVKEKYGYEMKYFRPPCGEYSEQSMAVCCGLGYKTLLWSFAYPDWDVNNQPDPTAALEKVTKAAHGGGIYLLHSVSSTNAEILPQVIDNLRAQGFELTLPNI
ncbi:MAG: polysaccharide deacetylase family protein [Oscillospiraceae bacterium]|nr:polysaccharide deacetylase family protein [Oscillospiraceae bacterium]